MSDTGNGRVSAWTGTSSFSSVSQSAPVAGSEFITITRDYYGDVYVADRARDRIIKFSGIDLTPLKTYGGSTSWANGSFNDPTDLHLIWHHGLDSSGAFVAEGLPYVQTTERWTDTTGGQLHRIGVDADELTVSIPDVDGAREATFTFLFTGNGEYTISVKNTSGYGVRSWPTVVADGGRKSQYWDGKDSSGSLVPYGTYTVEVKHESGYMYDDGAARDTSKSFAFRPPYNVSADVPHTITEKGEYFLLGHANHPATNWLWERADADGSYYDWASWEDTTFFAYAGTCVFRPNLPTCFAAS